MMVVLTSPTLVGRVSAETKQDIDKRNEISYEAVYDRTARAFAKMEFPDFSGITREDVYQAFKLLFPGDFSSGMDENLLNNLKAKIVSHSSGKITLSGATLSDRNNFNIEVRGRAGYFILKNKETGETKRVIIGPYYGPIIFDTEKK